MRNERLQKAIIEAENQIKAKPDLAEGWTFAGMLYDRLGDTINAKYYYKKSIMIYDSRILCSDKKNNIAINRFNRSVSLILLGQEQAGKDELRKLKKENSGNTQFDSFLKISKIDYMNEIFDKK